MFFKRTNKVSYVYTSCTIQNLQSKKNARKNFSRKDSKNRAEKNKDTKKSYT